MTTHREYPILFSAPMILANRAGRKTQTRRVITLRNVHDIDDTGTPMAKGWDDIWREARCPYGQPGDRLWVRETFDFLPDGSSGERDNCVIVYGADGAMERRTAPADYNPMIYNRRHWRPSIHMPRWASRNTYEIVAVRPQRLQDITPGEAAAEGLARRSKDGGRTWKWGLPDRDGLPGTDDCGWPWPEWCVDPGTAYSKLWDSINAGCVYGWDKNPWVWVITYRDITAQARAEAAA